MPQTITRLWRLLPHNQVEVEALARSLNCSSIVAQILHNRGFTDSATASRFLSPNLTGLYPPQDLPGLNQAVEVILASVRAGEKICVYGDYDVDGVTGTAILWQLLQCLGAAVERYTPRRVEEGYGLNSLALKQLHADGVKLVVTVDCGIASVNEAQDAKLLGLKLVITDHHEFKATLPDADALVHPRLPGFHYPFGGLSGSVVAFKVAWGLAEAWCGSKKVTPDLREILLDAVMLASLGLIADVVPLHDENRIIVRHGLNRLQKTPTLGMKALLEVAGIPIGTPILAETVAFRLAPRMNAAGRMGSAGLVVEMLTTKSPSKAQEIARLLDSQNSERQTREREMFVKARDLISTADWANHAGIVLALPFSTADWHPGIVGIVAGRLVEAFGRPVLALGIDEERNIASGSGRSIPGFELHHALTACDEHLMAHGGHAMAVGLKLAPDKIDDLREAFRIYAADHFPEGIVPPPCLTIDAEVPLTSFTFNLLNEIDKLEPYGEQNSRPCFLLGPVEIASVRRIGKGERHLSFQVRQHQTAMRAVAWNMGERFDEIVIHGKECHLVVKPQMNEFQGRRNVELQVIDLQFGTEAMLE